MRFEAWEPEYRRILQEFGFSRSQDEESAEELRHLLEGLPLRLEGAYAEDALSRRLRGKDALLVGMGPGLLPLPVPSPWLPRGDWVVIAADGATSACLEWGTLPAVIVTDLDGKVEDEVKASAQGSLVIVHAHGDNRPALRTWVPHFRGPVIGSCAGLPGRGLLNPGGFTDGDRALFIAEEFGARRALLAAYDFVHPSREPAATRPIKRRKLATARRLVDSVARRGRLRVELLTSDLKVRPW
ncbi:MAG: DUF115 domain-containing protein [Euryarchaeota archaeon]|nr:DUF115 domain-containing protein [Euryarchaeota archaeon]